MCRRPRRAQMGVTVAYSDLARDTASLVSIANSSRARSLNELAALAARQVPAYQAATAALWVDDEPVLTAASHPDISDLVDVELASREGPELLAIATGGATRCPDTLREDRWPTYASAALSRGVRCCLTLVHSPGPAAVTLTLFGARPQPGEAGQLPLAELLVAVGSAVIGNVSHYQAARRTALQLQDAVESRALIDQAKGILMQSLGCSADDALGRMRRMSQRHSLRMTEVARRVADSSLAQGR